MKCDKCGAPRGEGNEKFCTHCGAAFGEANATPTAGQNGAPQQPTNPYGQQPPYQNGQQPPPYGQQTPPPSYYTPVQPKSSSVTTGLVLGIIGVVLIWCFGFIFGIIGLIFGLKGFNEEKAANRPTNLAIVAIVLSLIALVGSIILMITSYQEFMDAFWEGYNEGIEQGLASIMLWFAR